MIPLLDTVERVDQDYKFKRVKPTNEYSSMTYILGSRCKDGVVLVADKKIVNVNGGTEYEYGNKLFIELENLIIGYSGFRRTFELFRNDLADYITSYRDGYHASPTIYKVNSQIAEIIFKLHNRYRGESFDLLMAVSGETTLEKNSRLIHFYPDGTMETVKECKAIGTGAPYGSIFLKQNWHENMTMREVAELGYFIIKYIERYHLDLSVGVNKDKPQVWFIPDNEANYSANIEVLNELEGKTEMSLRRIEENKLHKLFLL